MATLHTFSTHKQYIGRNGREYWVGSYRHAMPYPADNLYRAVRRKLNLSGRQMALKAGVTYHQWMYRERLKRMYHLAEILWCQELGGFNNDEMIDILNDCA